MSCNHLQPRVTEMRASDTMSEISESGTTNSGWTSECDLRDDFRDFIAKIGLKDSSELHKDRFRVDRKKLEQMMCDDKDALLPADIFFEQIMEDTNTFITWPNKLKIGAKSKKDPHVRIAGRREDVEAAKARIMSTLETRSDRVTMKMDVSYTDHSHIIGKGGHSIRRVMEETHCHVHFPDSNRLNSNEKSNQVSIAGDIRGVELARSRVRQKTPVIFGFELPIMVNSVDVNTPPILKIQEQYGVQLILRTRAKLHATLVLVKGVEWEVDQVKEATILFVEYLCDHLANQTTIQMTMEISPIHHALVIGKNHQNLKDIMQATNTQILFPDAQDPNIPSIKKSNVTITGSIHNVYSARQMLTGSLPLILMFDLPENLSNVKTELIVQIQAKYDVIINIRNKAKHNTMICLIKAPERNATNIYRARSAILGHDEVTYIADIPPSYQMPANVHDVLTPTPMNPHPLTTVGSPIWHYPPTSFNNPSSQNLAPVKPFINIPMNQTSHFPFTNLSAAAGSGQSSLASSGYQSLGHCSGSLLSLEQSRDASTFSTISPSSSFSVKSSPTASPRKNAPFASRSGHSPPTALDSPEKLSEYQAKRMSGFIAMQERPGGGKFRYPTGSWSGYGISMTSPAPIKDDSPFDKDDNIWKSPSKVSPSPMNSSNPLDHTPNYMVNRITSSKWPDLPSLLTSIGCEKYIGMFNSHEVDLATFASINDNDLIALGVNIFGCRRRMLLAISELNKRDIPFLPAPGAERKVNSPSSTSSYSPREKCKQVEKKWCMLNRRDGYDFIKISIH